VCIAVSALLGSTTAALLESVKPEVKLPKPLSDVAASVGPDGLIYITGGCDSALGSKYVNELGAFRCSSVSNSFYAFDPKMEQFMNLPDMPYPRYRHASVAINSQIWLVGGRDELDRVVGIVHVRINIRFLVLFAFANVKPNLLLTPYQVYDILDGRWRSFRDLYGAYWVSDLGGFSAQGRAYFLGGFTPDYLAVRRVFSIDPVSSWKKGRLDILRHANLVHRRGDIGVTLGDNETYAYVSGGSSHTNAFCLPLDTVERYSLENNTWDELPPLVQGRAGKTMVHLSDQLVALGGAQQIQKLCNKTSGDPSDLQAPVYEVEIFEQGKWDVVDELSGYRFRSTSIVYNETVYNFGGQSAYFSVCACHPTVDDVVIYRPSDTDELGPPFISDYGVNTEDSVYGVDGILGRAESKTGNNDGQPTQKEEVEAMPDGPNLVVDYNRDGFVTAQSSGPRNIPTDFVFALASGGILSMFV